MPTLISFLGAGRYAETTYVYGQQRHTSSYMADAAVRFFHPERLLVVVTEQAATAHLAALKERLAGVLEPEPVEIPSGQSEAEQWAMFSKVAQQIAPGSRLVFDITNGFRSIPLLALLIAAYVRVVRDATLQHVVYGAFDARDQQTNETPVFDLTPLVRLLDWTSATDAFLKYGRADDLMALARRHDGGSLDQFADSLSTLTAGLQTSRPTEVQVTAASLDAQIAAVRTDATTPLPIGLLLDRISAEYAPLGHDVPTDAARAEEVLQGQMAIIKWYVKKGMHVQAITLAREWLVSWVVANVGGDLFADQDRGLAEGAINKPHDSHVGVYDKRRRAKRDIAVPSEMQAAVQNKLLRSLWNDTRDLRNDLGHTGMRLDPRLAATVESQVRAVCARLPELLNVQGATP